ncbi:MAG TPA: hypothetical protein VFX60_19165 [Micromonospora sp.]|nr:hypothetical protein [Micromonospora sp.]
MPYGQGRTNRELKKAARDYAKTDDTHTYEITTPAGTVITVNGINSAKAVAGKDGTIRKVS